MVALQAIKRADDAQNRKMEKTNLKVKFVQLLLNACKLILQSLNLGADSGIDVCS